MRIFSFGIVATVLFGLFHSAYAQCDGKNLLETLPAGDAALLAERVGRHPYTEGNIWKATTGNSTIYVVGTLHFYDPQVDPIIETANELLPLTDQVFLELSPEDMSGLEAMMLNDPDLLFINSGPSLLEQLDAELWQSVSEMLAARGVPGFMAAKLQPWYANLLLSVPPCAMTAIGTADGVDFQIMHQAMLQGIPVLGLEEPEAVLALISGGDPSEQILALEYAASTADISEDSFFTMIRQYAEGRHREVLELSYILARQSGFPEAELNVVFNQVERDLMDTRNAAWIDLLIPAAQNKTTLVATGALHLSGDQGILNLLHHAGYQLERIQ